MISHLTTKDHLLHHHDPTQTRRIHVITYILFAAAFVAGTLSVVIAALVKERQDYGQCVLTEEWKQDVLDHNLATGSQHEGPLPVIANGYIQTTPGSSSLYVRGVYVQDDSNNSDDPSSPKTRLARLPSPMAFAVTLSEPRRLCNGLDFRQGMFKQRALVAGLDLNTIENPYEDEEETFKSWWKEIAWMEQRWYAHRSLRNMLVHETRMYDGRLVSSTPLCVSRFEPDFRNADISMRSVNVSQVFSLPLSEDEADKELSIDGTSVYSWVGTLPHGQTDSDHDISVAMVFTLFNSDPESGSQTLNPDKDEHTNHNVSLACGHVHTQSTTTRMMSVVTSLEISSNDTDRAEDQLLSSSVYDEYQSKLNAQELSVLQVALKRYDEAYKKSNNTEDEEDYIEEGSSGLHAEHVSAWKHLWDTADIGVESHKIPPNVDSKNKKASVIPLLVKSTLYQLLSNMREDWPYGIGSGDNQFFEDPNAKPSSESSESSSSPPVPKLYTGTVTWKEEMYIFPSLVLMYPQMAETILQYRFDTLGDAQSNAADHGRSGAMYPWESALSGEEVSNDPWKGQRIHVGAAISRAFAMHHFLSYYNDNTDSSSSQWAQEKAWPVISAIADYYLDIASVNSSQKVCSIRKVTPPDDSVHGVRDSYYCNTAAAMALDYAVDLHSDILPPGQFNVIQWFECKSNMIQLLDKSKGVHPEFRNYDWSHHPNQADVVLVQWPLGYTDIPPDTRVADVSFYGNSTAETAPPSTWMMYSIAHLALNNMEEADKLLNKGLNSIAGPFLHWQTVENNTDNESSDHINSDAIIHRQDLTSASSFLQTVLYGYMGVCIEPSRISINPSLPKGTKRLTLRGLHYLGWRIRIEANEDKIEVTIISGSGPALTLRDHLGTVHPLHKHQTQKMDVGQIFIFPNTL